MTVRFVLYFLLSCTTFVFLPVCQRTHARTGCRPCGTGGDGPRNGRRKLSEAAARRSLEGASSVLRVQRYADFRQSPNLSTTFFKKNETALTSIKSSRAYIILLYTGSVGASRVNNVLVCQKNGNALFLFIILLSNSLSIHPNFSPNVWQR